MASTVEPEVEFRRYAKIVGTNYAKFCRINQSFKKRTQMEQDAPATAGGTPAPHPLNVEMGSRGHDILGKRIEAWRCGPWGAAKMTKCRLESVDAAPGPDSSTASSPRLCGGPTCPAAAPALKRAVVPSEAGNLASVFWIRSASCKARFLASLGMTFHGFRAPVSCSPGGPQGRIPTWQLSSILAVAHGRVEWSSQNQTGAR